MKDSVLGVLLMAYIAISQVATIIFFIDICKEWDSLVGIIFLGPFVAELKGLFWIFLIW